jgi:hypothetical protein
MVSIAISQMESKVNNDTKFGDVLKKKRKEAMTIMKSDEKQLM